MGGAVAGLFSVKGRGRWGWRWWSAGAWDLVGDGDKKSPRASAL